MNEQLQQALAKSPFAASDYAAGVDYLFYTMLAICSLVTLAIAGLIIFFCVRYRRSNKERDRSIALRNARLPEYLWIGLPLIIFIGFFIWGALLFMQFQQLPEKALQIHAVAKQWMWKFYHPGGQREINQLHIPVDRPVIVTLASEDVIHSFFIPNFRVKQDVVPGRYTRIAFTANEPGAYRLFCAEYCGTEHSEMYGVIHVMNAADYANWLQHQDHSPTLATAGEKLFRAQGCSGCHNEKSTVHAPSLRGIFGRVVHLSDGRSMVADLAYLRDAILLPEKHIVAGYKPIMPSYASQLSEEEILKLMSYLQFTEMDKPQ